MTEGVTCGEHWSQHKKDLPNGRHPLQRNIVLRTGLIVNRYLFTSTHYLYILLFLCFYSYCNASFLCLAIISTSCTI
jgi:hypothetical protein